MLIEETDFSGSSYDLCVIGSGAAGISVAREYLNSNFRVALIESGGEVPKPEISVLNEGETSQEISEALHYLTSSRVRSFGGTTNIWNGWTRPLDKLDFEKRSWVHNSGWPVSRADLAPFYDRAATICQVPVFGEDRPFDELNIFGRKSKFHSKEYHFSPPTRFGDVYGKDLKKSPNISVILNATVTNLLLRSDGNILREVEVKTFSGKRFFIRAKAFVLACGGIENSRLLLSSNSVHKSGIGNSNDLVGRYFMEHPHLMMADAIHSPSEKLPAYFRFSGKRALLSPKKNFQEEMRTLNFAIVIHNAPPPMSNDESVMASHLKKNIGTRNLRKTRVELRIEQAPHAENRITLSSRSDRFGSRLPRLNWKMNSLDFHTAREGLRLFISELGSNNLGRVKNLRENFERAELKPSDPESGFLSLWHHHMGGTRMHENPKLGVVDSRCKVHGVENLYVVGGSVFPTSGYANPTLTIVALALRLSAHLKNRLPEMQIHA